MMGGWIFDGDGIKYCGNNLASLDIMRLEGNSLLRQHNTLCDKMLCSKIK